MGGVMAHYRLSFVLRFFCRCGHAGTVNSWVSLVIGDRSTSLSNGAIMLPSQLNWFTPSIRPILRLSTTPGLQCVQRYEEILKLCKIIMHIVCHFFHPPAQLNPSDCHSSHTTTPSFWYGTSFLCGTEPSVRNALALYEASTLKAERADIRSSGQFALDWSIYISLGENSISYIGLDDDGSFNMPCTYVWTSQSQTAS